MNYVLAAHFERIDDRAILTIGQISMRLRRVSALELVDVFRAFRTGGIQLFDGSVYFGLTVQADEGVLLLADDDDFYELGHINPSHAAHFADQLEHVMPDAP